VCGTTRAGIAMSCSGGVRRHAERARRVYVVRGTVTAAHRTLHDRYCLLHR
jgi:hypothetical protein